MARPSGNDAVVAYAEARLAGTFGRPVAAGSVALHPTDDRVAAVAEVRDHLLAPARGVVTTYGAAGPDPAAADRQRDGRLPAWSPDGSRLAHLDDTGVWIGDLHRTVTGHVERLAWAPDGDALLLVVAEPGSELPGVAGSGLVPGAEPWEPRVESTDGSSCWRRLVLLDPATGATRTVGRPDLTVWDACWAGPQVLAVCSDGSASESAWYAADLRLLDPATGTDHVVVRPEAQVGAVTASPSGRRIAWVESVASDRDLVAGDLQVLDLDTGETRRLAAPTDVSDAAFVSETEVGFAGLEGLTTVLGFVDVATGDRRVLWESVASTASGLHPRASFRPGRIAFSHVGPRTRPEVLLLDDDGRTHVAASLPASTVGLPGTSRVHRWTAPDELEVEGWLHLPDGPGPHPLVVLLHGGPIASHRATWGPLGLTTALLLDRGYAVLQPNPRGSAGRGQAFARAVVGDMGGADADDVVAGVRSLVDDGTVDPTRVGLTGGSYGGYLAAWLVTRHDWFAAAVAQHPVTDWAQQHGTACMPVWDELFLDGSPHGPGGLPTGQYVERSPLAHAAAVRTPTLLLAGTLDRATPPGQALAMHRALAARGVPSACVTYPTAGHGPRETAAVLDALARTVDWFERWMPASSPAPHPTTEAS
ncbi:S9 family peptidase [Nocardioides litoris]|uniref:S9 family peptidase n=1 Tax=Nocardioides litoris TaxID=1926648 RepID=UPI00111CE9FD|nr:S9 family peptidase [Nocardioides litoris]